MQTLRDHKIKYNGHCISIKILLEKYSVKFGEFTLRSGKKSDFYIDCRPVILSPEGHMDVGFIFASKCWAEFEAAQFVATGVGGSYIASAAALVAQGHIIHVRDSKKEHGTKRKVELPAGFSKGTTNMVVVDDVLTTGSSLAVCLDGLADIGLKAAGCLVLVDRQEGGKETIENKYGIPVKSIFRKSEFRQTTNKII